MSQWINTMPGVRRRTVAVGDQSMQMLVDFEPGASTPEHSHLHEQLTYVVKGRMIFTVAGEVREVSQGETILFRGNVPHAARAAEATTLLDTFTPVRDDLVAIDKQHGT